MELLGHDGTPTGMWDENLITEKPLTRCPIRDVLIARAELRQEVYELAYDYYPMFKHGHLLVEGAIDDQPARWIESMMYLDHLDRAKKSAYEKKTRESND